METLSLQPLQRYFEGFYCLERATSVDDFVSFGAQNERETVYARCNDDVLELEIRLPEAVNALGPLTDHLPAGALKSADLWAQVIEAVSHFVLLAERARVELPTTHLELELQAEIDKFLLFARPFDANPEGAGLHEQLFESVRYLHPSDTESGARYRFVNRMAARYTAALARSPFRDDARLRLQRFFRAGQAEKLSLVHAA